MNTFIIAIIAVLSAYLGFVVHAMLLSSTLADAQRLTDIYESLTERFIAAYECDNTPAPTLAMIAAYNTAKQALRKMRVTA